MKIYHLLIFAVVLNGCGTIKLKPTDGALQNIGCGKLTINNKTGNTISPNKKCNCIIKKIESMNWSSKEKCLIKNISKDLKHFKLCSINSSRIENEVFRPFIEKYILINRQCHEEVTGEKYPYLL